MTKRYIYMAIGVILLIVIIKISIYGGCCGNEQREAGLCPNASCSWERSNSRCNDDEECCPGKRCNSFGYCETCSGMF